MISPENKLIVVPNSLATANNITNYTAEGKIRVDVQVGVSYNADLKKTKAVLQEMLLSNTSLLKTPAASVLVHELGDSSVNLILRGYAKPEHYWDAYFSMTEQAKITLDTHNIEIPYPHQVVQWHDMSK